MNTMFQNDLNRHCCQRKRMPWEGPPFYSFSKYIPWTLNDDLSLAEGWLGTGRMCGCSSWPPRNLGKHVIYTISWGHKNFFVLRGLPGGPADGEASSSSWRILHHSNGPIPLRKGRRFVRLNESKTKQKSAPRLMHLDAHIKSTAASLTCAPSLTYPNYLFAFIFLWKRKIVTSIPPPPPIWMDLKVMRFCSSPQFFGGWGGEEARKGRQREQGI